MNTVLKYTLLAFIFVFAILVFIGWRYLSLTSSPIVSNIKEQTKKIPVVGFVIPQQDSRFIFNSKNEKYTITIGDQSTLDSLLVEWGNLNELGFDSHDEGIYRTINKIEINLLTTPSGYDVNKNLGYRILNNDLSDLLSDSVSVYDKDNSILMLNVYISDSFLSNPTSTTIDRYLNNETATVNDVFNTQVTYLLFHTSAQNMRQLIKMETVGEQQDFTKTKVFDQVLKWKQVNNYPFKVSRKVF